MSSNRRYRSSAYSSALSPTSYSHFTSTRSGGPSYSCAQPTVSAYSRYRPSSSSAYRSARTNDYYQLGNRYLNSLDSGRSGTSSLSSSYSSSRPSSYSSSSHASPPSKYNRYSTVYEPELPDSASYSSAGYVSARDFKHQASPPRLSPPPAPERTSSFGRRVDQNSEAATSLAEFSSSTRQPLRPVQTVDETSYKRIDVFESPVLKKAKENEAAAAETTTKAAPEPEAQPLSQLQCCPLPLLAAIANCVTDIKSKCGLRAVCRALCAAVDHPAAWDHVQQLKVDLRVVATDSSYSPSYVCVLNLDGSRHRIMGTLIQQPEYTLYGHPVDTVLAVCTRVAQLHITSEYSALAMLLPQCQLMPLRYLTHLHLTARVSPGHDGGELPVVQFIHAMLHDHSGHHRRTLSLRLEPFDGELESDSERQLAALWDGQGEAVPRQGYAMPGVLQVLQTHCPADALSAFELRALQPFNVQLLFDVLSGRRLQQLGLELVELPDEADAVLAGLVNCLQPDWLERLDITQLSFEPPIDVVRLLGHLRPASVSRVTHLSLCVQRSANENMLDWLLLVPALFPALQQLTCRSHAHLPLDALDLILFVSEWLHSYDPERTLLVKSVPMMSGLAIEDLLVPIGVEMVESVWLQPSYRQLVRLRAPGTATLSLELVYAAGAEPTAPHHQQLLGVLGPIGVDLLDLI